MTIKEKIEADFIAAYKERKPNVKSALSFIKSEILLKEKESGASALDDAQVIKILTSAMKRRKESAAQYLAANRNDLAQQENEHQNVDGLLNEHVYMAWVLTVHLKCRENYDVNLLEEICSGLDHVHANVKYINN